MAIRIPSNGAPISTDDVKGAEVPWAEVMIHRLHRDFLRDGGDAAMKRLRAYLKWFEERARIEDELKSRYPVGSLVQLNSGGPVMCVEKHGAVVEQDGQNYIDLDVVHYVEFPTPNGSPISRLTMRSSIVRTEEESVNDDIAKAKRDMVARLKINDARASAEHEAREPAKKAYPTQTVPEHLRTKHEPKEPEGLETHAELLK